MEHATSLLTNNTFMLHSVVGQITAERPLISGTATTSCISPGVPNGFSISCLTSGSPSQIGSRCHLSLFPGHRLRRIRSGCLRCNRSQTPCVRTLGPDSGADRRDRQLRAGRNVHGRHPHRVPHRYRRAAEGHDGFHCSLLAAHAADGLGADSRALRFVPLPGGPRTGRCHPDGDRADRGVLKVEPAQLQ